MMDHPNIAKVLDAGSTDTGRPFFVMELVRGIPITQYCDQQRLSARERLGLFIKVCHAIQHAHQKGIIHRDIKPSNILVTLHDGRVIADSAAYSFVRLWDVATRRELPAPTGGAYPRGNVSLAFSPVGARLAAGGTSDTAMIHDLATGESLLLTGHLGTIWAMAFSPDGKTLATGGVDQTVKLWMVSTGQELMTLEEYGKRVSVLMFSPDGRTLAAGSFLDDIQPGPVRLWRAPLLEEIDAAESDHR